MRNTKRKKIVADMIKIYCRGKRHETRKINLCNECEDLLEYCKEQLTNCPFKDENKFCSKCEVHCFNSEKRKHIIRVMRYSGPRMILHHPIAAFRHMISTTNSD